MAHAVTTYQSPLPSSTRSSVSWGAVFAGTLIGAALLVLLSLLLSAAAQSSSGSTFSVHLGWWLSGAAILCTFVAGLLASALARGRGAGMGLAHGLTVWALLTVVSLLTASGAVTAFRSLVSATPVQRTGPFLWAGFWAVLVGLAAAGVGGLIGGLLPGREDEAVVVQTRDSDAPRDVRVLEVPESESALTARGATP